MSTPGVRARSAHQGLELALVVLTSIGLLALVVPAWLWLPGPVWADVHARQLTMLAIAGLVLLVGCVAAYVQLVMGSDGPDGASGLRVVSASRAALSTLMLASVVVLQVGALAFGALELAAGTGAEASVGWLGVSLIALSLVVVGCAGLLGRPRWILPVSLATSHRQRH